MTEPIKAKRQGFLTSEGDKPKYIHNVLYKVVIFILLTSMFERCAYYFMTSSMVRYFSVALGIEKVKANNLQAIFQAIVYIVPTVISVAIDVYFARLVTIPPALWGCVLGGILLSLGAFYKNQPLSYVALFCFIALCDSSIKPSLMSLGGDQFDLTKPDHLKQKGHMFQLYYWATNIAAGLGYYFGPSISSKGIGGISAENGYLATFVFSSIMFSISACILTFTGIIKRKFFVRKVEGSFIPKFLGLSWKAAGTSKRGMLLVISCMFLLFAVLLSIPNMLISSHPEAQEVINYIIASIVLFCLVVMISVGSYTGWIANSSTVPDEEKSDMVAIWRITPYLAFCIPFWAIYNQMMTNFFWQACQYDNYLDGNYYNGNDPFQAASMGLFNSMVIVICIPIFDYLVFPGLEKVGVKDTNLRRLGAGLCFATLGVTLAAVLEINRRGVDSITVECNIDTVNKGWCTLDSDFSTTYGLYQSGWAYKEGANDIDTYNALLDLHGAEWNSGLILPIPPNSTAAKPMAYVINDCIAGLDKDDPDKPLLLEFSPIVKTNIMLMILPYACVGIGEILFAATCTDFFYSQVPAHIRSTMQALNMLTVSLGTIAGGINDLALKKYIATNLDNGHLEYVYFTAVGLTFIAIASFIFKSRKFEYRVEVNSTTTDKLTGDSSISSSSSISNKETDLKDVSSGSSFEKISASSNSSSSEK